MIDYILDASVAAKWYLPAAHEPLTDEAFRLLNDHRAGRVDFLVPDLFFVEFGSIFWKAIRSGRCDEETANRAIGEILGKEWRAVAAAELLQTAHELVRAHKRSMYDCIYVALAVRTNSQFVTADEKLANAVGARLPVLWLGLL